MSRLSLDAWPASCACSGTHCSERGHSQGRASPDRREAAWSTARTGLERVRLRHRALPERDLAVVAGSSCSARAAAPLIVYAMTGGTPRPGTIKRRLPPPRSTASGWSSARAVRCSTTGPARHLPARRPAAAADRQPGAQVRARRGRRAERLVEVLGADGLSVHLNPLQEAIQPEGEPRVRAACSTGSPQGRRGWRRLPVVVKEVGFGMDPGDVRALARVGVAAVDVAGAGGTNWALIEGRRDARAGGGGGVRGLGRAHRAMRGRRVPPRPGCRSIASAGCATASRRPSAWRSARRPAARAAAPARGSGGPGRRGARDGASTSCGSPCGLRARRRRAASGRSSCA